MNYAPPGIEIITQPVFDWHLITGKESHLEFFIKPIGIDGKTYEDTNMYLSRMMPRLNQLVVCAFGVYFVPGWPEQIESKTDLSDLRRVMAHGVFEFRVCNRTYFRIAPLAVLQPGFPNYWAMDDKRLRRLLRKAEKIKMVDKLKNPNGPFEVRPIMIESGQSFYCSIDFPNNFRLASSGKLGVILYSAQYRPTV